MKIETLVLGQLQTNCYLIWDEESREAVVIDPADEADFIIRKILDLDLKLKLIIATHGHFDHVLGLLELKLAFNVPFLMNKLDNFLLERTVQTTKHFTGINADPTPLPDQDLRQDDQIFIGKTILRVIETPGHTPGSVSLYCDGALFDGDLAFADGFGRTDLSYSSPEDLRKSVNKILKLPINTILYSGHGEQTTVGKINKMW